MKRLQFMIEEELDRRLEVVARRQRCSKAALIRKYVSEQLPPALSLEEDPITLMIGADDVDYGDIDDEVYR